MSLQSLIPKIPWILQLLIIKHSHCIRPPTPVFMYYNIYGQKNVQYVKLKNIIF